MWSRCFVCDKPSYLLEMALKYSAFEKEEGRKEERKHETEINK
jgi:hypothetical protein